MECTTRAKALCDYFSAPPVMPHFALAWRFSAGMCLKNEHLALRGLFANIHFFSFLHHPARSLFRRANMHLFVSIHDNLFLPGSL